MPAIKSSFADVLRSPEMQRMIQDSTAEDVYKSSAFAEAFGARVFKSIRLGDLTFKIPGDLRRVHELITHLPENRRIANRRVALEHSLSKAITDNAMWQSNEPRDRQWPHLFMNRLAEQLVNNLVCMRILHRRPFRCDQDAADAWLASALLMMEAA